MDTDPDLAEAIKEVEPQDYLVQPNRESRDPPRLCVFKHYSTIPTFHYSIGVHINMITYKYS